MSLARRRPLPGAAPTGYTVARQVADLEAARRRIGANRVVLLGSSWGATLAAEYMAAHQLTVADPRPALRRIHAPAMVLRGECDYKDPAIAREYRDTFPNATLRTIDGAGHVIEADRPAAYRDAVTSFLTGPAAVSRDKPVAPIITDNQADY
ncbi:hypothetical protein [Streptomyces sp. 5-10]|uniref:alpha/beta fold hydrolase n=1 Tax=Streptomyces sp. 5-10 TaxID=878925 RepID=UPI00295E759A|nr:hypothetical protein [Streptomyces sp. 5-10]